MTCEECSYLGAVCDDCRCLALEDIERRAEARKSLRKAFKKLDSKCPRCGCCSKLSLAMFYKACPDDSYVGYKVQSAKGGKHCINNLKYFVKTT